MKSWKVYLAAGAIFISGAVVGGVGTAYVVKREVSRFFDGGPRARRDFMLSRLTKKLNLTEQQRSEVAQVFDETQRRFENLRDQHGAEIDGILEGGKDRIKEHLSPDQQQEFERIVERMRARWQKGRGPKGPPPPPFEPG